MEQELLRLYGLRWLNQSWENRDKSQDLHNVKYASTLYGIDLSPVNQAMRFGKDGAWSGFGVQTSNAEYCKFPGSSSISDKKLRRENLMKSKVTHWVPYRDTTQKDW